MRCAASLSLPHARPPAGPSVRPPTLLPSSPFRARRESEREGVRLLRFARYTSRRRVLVAAAATTTTTTSLSSIASLFRAGLHAVYIVNSFPFSYTSPFGAVNWIAFTGSNIQSEKYTTAACQLPPLPALFVGLPLPPSPSLSAAAVAAAAASSPSPRSRPPPPRALASPLSFSRACEIPIRGNFIYIHRPRRSRASVCHDA